MTDSVRRRRVRFVAVVLVALLAFSGGAASAHDESAVAIEAYLHGLVEGGALTEVQHQQIENLYFKGHLSQLDSWLEAQETAGQLSEDTHVYLDALLGLGTPVTVAAAAPAAYTGNGNVTKLGQINPQPRAPTTATTPRRARCTTTSGGMRSARGSTRCNVTASACTSST